MAVAVAVGYVLGGVVTIVGSPVLMFAPLHDMPWLASADRSRVGVRAGG